MTQYSVVARDDYKRCVCDAWGDKENDCSKGELDTSNIKQDGEESTPADIEEEEESKEAEEVVDEPEEEEDEPKEAVDEPQEADEEPEEADEKPEEAED